MTDDCQSVAPVRVKRNTDSMTFTPEEEAELLETFHYDPLTGIVTWKKDGGRWGQYKAGSEAGSTNGRGRRLLSLRGRPIKTPRFAFFFMTGRWSSAPCIDHIDGDTLNNRFSNLREATHAENSQNRRTSSLNTSGYKGVVHLRKSTSRNKFESRIRVHGKTHRLGAFQTTEEAWEAYASAALFLHGEFVNLD